MQGKYSCRLLGSGKKRECKTENDKTIVISYRIHRVLLCILAFSGLNHTGFIHIKQRQGILEYILRIPARPYAPSRAQRVDHTATASSHNFITNCGYGGRDLYPAQKIPLTPLFQQMLAMLLQKCLNGILQTDQLPGQPVSLS